MVLTLLTATGCRPEQWALCEKMMAAQDYDGHVRWIIVDDGQTPQPVTFAREGWSLEVIRPTPAWSHGQNTQARNLREGLAVIPDDARVVVIEDDDYYAPRWLTAITKLLDIAELAGESYARYYHVGRRFWLLNRNDRHASLCASAMRGEALRLFRQIAGESHTYIDMQLWERFHGRKILGCSCLTVGIKGLPGRAGIGYGHVMDGTHDRNAEVLRQWVGSIADDYMRIAAQAA